MLTKPVLTKPVLTKPVLALPAGPVIVNNQFRMHPTKLIHKKSLPPQTFPPLTLAQNDHLPRAIELVIAYDYLISPDQLESAFNHGVEAFPHVTGQIQSLEAGKPWHILPSSRGLPLEIFEMQKNITIRILEQLPVRTHRSYFMPGTDEDAPQDHLLAARLTQTTDGLSILGLKASHAALDGTGLGLFLYHCTARIHGKSPPAVIHQRPDTHINPTAEIPELPHGYTLAENPADISDDLAARPSTIFTINIKEACHQLGASSYLDARLRLSACLCHSLANIHPGFSEIAVWCDPRGLPGFPATFTGNSGCYLHIPLQNLSATDLTKRICGLASRQGFRKTAETQQRIQQAQNAGHHVAWKGPADDILQLNLVPHAAESANFGHGPPVFGLMLSRNSSGLRIAITPDGRRFLIEAALPDPLGPTLPQLCRDAHLTPEIWCQGTLP